MNQKLENIIQRKNRPIFKSEGERKIAYFLENNSIRYQYEPGVLVNSLEGKPRIWYPDFYLPEFGTYIEYFGLVGRQDYDKGIKRKGSTYSKMGLSVIAVYPWTFAENWEGYIMKELERTTFQRYKSLMNKPYWSQKRSHTNYQSIHTGRRYGQGHGKHY